MPLSREVALAQPEWEASSAPEAMPYAGCSGKDSLCQQQGPVSDTMRWGDP